MCELPSEVLTQCVALMRRGATNKAIAAWLVLQPNLGGCTGLCFQTFRTYLPELRVEVRRRDRGRARYLRRLHRKTQELEGEQKFTAASLKIDQAYAASGAAAPPPSLPGGPPPAGPSAPAPPAPPAGGPPDEPGRSAAAIANDIGVKEQPQSTSNGLPKPGAWKEECERDMAAAQTKLKAALAADDLHQLHALDVELEFERFKRSERFERQIGILSPEGTKCSRLMSQKISAFSRYVMDKARHDREVAAVDHDWPTTSVEDTSAPSPNCDEQLCEQEHEVRRKIQGLTPPSRMLMRDAAQEAVRIAELEALARKHGVEPPASEPQG